MDYFLLDSKSGDLRTARPLDKEQIIDENGAIKIKVRAREIIDGLASIEPSSSTVVDIFITISDENDSPPTFNQKEYFVTISENTPNGTPLPVEISVSDADVGNNSIFNLRLDDVSEIFDVEPKTVIGSSHVNVRIWNGTLDYENPNHRKFIVLLIAEETLTTQKLSSTATLQVQLVDVNDHRPVFQQDSYTADLLETATPGQLITTITAKDLDSGTFGDDGIRYTVTGAGAELFEIDNRTGAITVAECNSKLDRMKRQLEDLFTEYENDMTSTGLLGLQTTKATIQDYNTYTVENYSENVLSILEDASNNLDQNHFILGKYPCLDFETQSTYFLTVTVSSKARSF